MDRTHERMWTRPPAPLPTKAPPPPLHARSCEQGARRPATQPSTRMGSTHGVGAPSVRTHRPVEEAAPSQRCSVSIRSTPSSRPVFFFLRTRPSSFLFLPSPVQLEHGRSQLAPRMPSRDADADPRPTAFPSDRSRGAAFPLHAVATRWTLAAQGHAAPRAASCPHLLRDADQPAPQAAPRPACPLRIVAVR